MDRAQKVPFEDCAVEVRSFCVWQRGGQERSDPPILDHLIVVKTGGAADYA